MNKRIVVVAGPTAVGKTECAIRIAEEFNGEVVSCDSMQLYKYLDIGSAKPDKDELARATHHLVDVIDPREEFSVAIYSKLARKVIDDVLSRDKLPIIAGGTGLYLHSILYNMDFGTTEKNDERRLELEALAEEKGKEYVYNILKELSPEAASKVHYNNLQKVIRYIELAESDRQHQDFNFDDESNKNLKYDPILIGLEMDREKLYERINLRVDLLLKKGLIEEVKGLMDMGFTSDNISMKGIGYKEIIDYLSGEYDLARGVELVKRNTRRYAKRQLTWFRRYKDMTWFNLTHQNNSEILDWLRERI
ncbi:MAG: tRNA (adenosine(37)-N6)-dimethylallyltransferase MiaA [Eubacteriales bacterium]|nr:tRNA (adenosine(37)-N6)-dimethylallyltransferase MiaA [Eubacteriales bacterium]MDY3333091.1 tRNA (adenosine(37)-N6)-dimethylallyltransferase MiaA [Gallibacter sp.]